MFAPMSEFLFKDWTFAAGKSPIATSQQLEEAERLSGVHPCPDMFYYNSHLGVNYGDFSLSFSPVESLKYCKFINDQGVFSISELPRLKVKMAAEWNRSLSSSLGEVAELPMSHDWTFTTSYMGDVNNASATSCKVESFLPMELLADESIPIIHFQEIPFWEDELHDHGECSYVVRLRVTGKYWFVLARYSLKLNGVAERVMNVRYVHIFGSNEIKREVSFNQTSSTYGLLELGPAQTTFRYINA